MLHWVCSLLGIILLQEAACLSLDIQPRHITTLPQHNITILCRAGVALQFCRITLPGLESSLSLSPRTRPHKEYVYHGAGLERGECGVRLPSVSDKFSGKVTCGVGREEDPMEYTASMQLVVLRAPKPPVMDVRPSKRDYREGETINATCTIKDGRPAATIEWYIGWDKIDNNHLTVDTVDGKVNVHTVVQNLTRRLSWHDNDKELKCVGYHPAYVTTKDTVKRKLAITYPPVDLGEPITLYGYVINEPGEVSVQIPANPLPRFTWMVDDVVIEEGQKNVLEKYQANQAAELRPGVWKASLIVYKVTEEDLEKVFILKAVNREGERTYKIVLAITRLTFAAIVGILAGCGLVLGGVVLGIFLWHNRKKPRRESEEVKMEASTDLKKSKYTYSENIIEGGCTSPAHIIVPAFDSSYVANGNSSRVMTSTDPADAEEEENSCYVNLSYTGQVPREEMSEGTGTSSCTATKDQQSDGHVTNFEDEGAGDSSFGDEYL